MIVLTAEELIELYDALVETYAATELVITPRGPGERPRLELRRNGQSTIETEIPSWRRERAAAAAR